MSTGFRRQADGQLSYQIHSSVRKITTEGDNPILDIFFTALDRCEELYLVTLILGFIRWAGQVEL
jgi:hypothetical protein